MCSESREWTLQTAGCPIKAAHVHSGLHYIHQCKRSTVNQIYQRQWLSVLYSDDLSRVWTLDKSWFLSVWWENDMWHSCFCSSFLILLIQMILVWPNLNLCAFMNNKTVSLCFCVCERERERGYITYWVMNLKSSWIIGTFNKQCEKLHFETLQKMMANLVSYSTQCEIWKEM